MKAKKMDIQLKQTEIEKAVRNYVAQTIGINLTGKHLGIQFSATRGAAGIVANLTIEDTTDVQIPGYTDRDAPKSAEVHPFPSVAADANSTGSIDADAAALTETSVPAEKFDTVTAAAETKEATAEAKVEEVVTTAVDDASVPEATPVAEEPKSVGSLFNN